MYGATLDKGLRMRATGAPARRGTLGLVSPNFLAGNPISIRIWGLGSYNCPHQVLKAPGEPKIPLHIFPPTFLRLVFQF